MYILSKPHRMEGRKEAIIPDRERKREEELNTRHDAEIIQIHHDIVGRPARVRCFVNFL